MNPNLFRFALEQLRSSDWEHFERLCSAFLSTEYSSLRTMAHPSGDGGRDSEIFVSSENTTIAAQYSISKNWKDKIVLTISRLRDTLPDTRVLIFLSNHQIGSKADEIKARVLTENGIVLDIRDQSWFLERATTNSIREAAAEELIERIARPILNGEQIIQKPSSPLSSGEVRAALLFLGLQWQDDISDKGLTKLSFDALVRAALRRTHSEKRMSRQDIHAEVSKVLPSADRALIARYVDAALNRLAKRYIRHWKKSDEYCLTHEEHSRVELRLAELANEESDFREELDHHIGVFLRELDDKDRPSIDELRERIPRVMELFLLKRGEIFVTAVLSGGLRNVDNSDLMDAIFHDLAQYPPKDKGRYIPRIIEDIVQALLSEATTSTQKYLSRLANSYTLLSFLNETPDVQSATRKLFSFGTVWLDTTVLLPLFAEQLEDDTRLKKLTSIIDLSRQAGIEYRVTSGVIQEVNSHMNTAFTCSRYAPSDWRGRTPYLYHQYLLTGQDPNSFGKWLNLFRGDERPEDDLEQYLAETFGIMRKDLDYAVENVDDDLRWAAERLWSEAHESRRGRTQTDKATTQQLIQHDLETYLGVIGLRRSEGVTELGYRHWLLTLDRIAWKIRDRLREELPGKVPPSPLLSLSFLVNNLTFGPIRGNTDKGQHMSLPLFLDIELSESMPYDIMQIAADVRKENEGLPEFVIRRKVRDAIDKARRRGYLSDSTALDSEAEEGSTWGSIP